MMRAWGLKTSMILPLSMFLLGAGPASEVIVKPGDSIPAALGAVADGGTLELAEGRYRVNLVLNRNVTVQGAGADRTILDGGGEGRVLTVEEGARVTLRGVTVTGGKLDKELERDGGGIWNVGILTLEDSEVTGNVAVDDGGGIRNDGVLTLLRTKVHDNRATRWGSVGGGIYSPVIFGTPELRVEASTISGNVAGDNGGGIWCEGETAVIDSTVSGNSAAHTGGGIRNNGNLTITNSNIASNRAGTTGGGLHNQGEATLSGATFTGNSAGEGGVDCQGVVIARGRNTLKPEGCDLVEAPTAGATGKTP
jgi:hypothetical protein